jgi:hypothetical protein
MDNLETTLLNEIGFSGLRVCARDGAQATTNALCGVRIPMRRFVPIADPLIAAAWLPFVGTTVAASLALLIVFLLGLSQVAVAEPDIDSQVRDIVAENIAPVATENDAGGLASAVYVAGHMVL